VVARLDNDAKEVKRQAEILDRIADDAHEGASILRMAIIRQPRSPRLRRYAPGATRCGPAPRPGRAERMGGVLASKGGADSR
jgi:hypothetical protein